MTQKHIRLGTRGSKLALFQARLVKSLLEKKYDELSVELVEIKTSGDWTPQMGETRLSAQDGGKGLFCKEIEHALLTKAIDIGVHSLKDMPAFLPQGLTMDHFLKREDPRDVFVSEKYASLDALPEGAVIGTSSVRRQSFLLNKRPDLKIVPFRGNVPTRLDKVAAGQVDGTFLALAGLKRLDLYKEHYHVLPVSEFLPACGQGIIAIESRTEDKELHDVLSALNCDKTSVAAYAERALLAALDGSCRTPIGGYAEIQDGKLVLKAQLAAEDGSEIWEEQGVTENLTKQAALSLGQQLGLKLKARAPADLFLEDYECG